MLLRYELGVDQLDRMAEGSKHAKESRADQHGQRVSVGECWREGLSVQMVVGAGEGWVLGKG